MISMAISLYSLLWSPQIYGILVNSEVDQSFDFLLILVKNSLLTSYWKVPEEIQIKLENYKEREGISQENVSSQPPLLTNEEVEAWRFEWLI